MASSLLHDFSDHGQENDEIDEAGSAHGGNGSQRVPSAEGIQEPLDAVGQADERVTGESEGEHDGEGGLQGEVGREQGGLDGGERTTVYRPIHDGAIEKGLYYQTLASGDEEKRRWFVCLFV